MSKTKSRVHRDTSDKDFSQDGFIEDNSNEVSLQCHSFSDDDPNDEGNNDREEEKEDHFDDDDHGQDFILDNDNG